MSAKPIYKIRTLLNGRCNVLEQVTFHGGSTEKTVPFNLYVWVIEGGEHPVLIDTGLVDVEGFSRGTAAYIPGGVVQLPDERPGPMLRKAGVDPNDVSHVILTHLHGDHANNIGMYPNATVVVTRRGFLEALPQGISKGFMSALIPRWPDSLHLAEDEEILPGIRVFWIGGHSICSQAIAVNTAIGTVVFGGDTIYMYENIEQNRPIGWADPDECLRAMERIRREADVIIPGHDPRILERYPDGVIG